MEWYIEIHNLWLYLKSCSVVDLCVSFRKEAEKTQFTIDLKNLVKLGTYT